MRDPFGSLSRDEVRLLVRGEAPAEPRPALATLVDRVPAESDWVFERKLDGIRCVVRRDGDRVELFSRTGRSLAGGFPEVVSAFAAMDADDVVVDGEIVAFDGTRTSFEKLQPRMHAQNATPGYKGVAVVYYAFDLMHADGHDLRALPLRRRKAVLKEALDWGEGVRFTTHRNGGGVALLEEARRRGWEGLIAKRADRGYPSGRSRDWLKLKVDFAQELVIGGWTEPEGSRQRFGALLVGFYDAEGRLAYAGKVGSGFDEALLRSLSASMAGLAVDESPFTAQVERGTFPRHGIHWVRPELVCQVGFSEWTREGRLRHPRFQGLRVDKAARDVVREAPA